MKILHTADVHLKHTGDERWDTLQSLLSIARDQKVNIFVISGDLFDKDIDAENLRPKIRDLFSGNEFQIIIIPGNHDAQLLGDLYFGSNAVLLNDPFQPYLIGDTAFYGMAFETMDEHRVLERLHELKLHLSSEYKNILLYHGELLEVMFTRSDIGAEDETGYMPVRLSFFKELHIDYVLAGHFHTRFDIRSLPDGGYFVYPGSPVSITRRETGRRRVNIFEVGKPPMEYLLDSPHFEEMEVTLDPLDKTDPVIRIEEQLAAAHPHAKIILMVNGYINKDLVRRSEKELVNEIAGLTRERCTEVRYEFRDIQYILQDDLFKLFMTKLDTLDYNSGERQRIREMAMRAMIEAKK